MRENRLSGSEGGGAEANRLFLPLLNFRLNQNALGDEGRDGVLCRARENCGLTMKELGEAAGVTQAYHRKRGGAQILAADGKERGFVWPLRSGLSTLWNVEARP
jgi:hypothetical protein